MARYVSDPLRKLHVRYADEKLAIVIKPVLKVTAKPGVLDLLD